VNIQFIINIRGTPVFHITPVAEHCSGAPFQEMEAEVTAKKS
jgi:hypothetical protein